MIIIIISHLLEKIKKPSSDIKILQYFAFDNGSNTRFSCFVLNFLAVVRNHACLFMVALWNAVVCSSFFFFLSFFFLA